MFVAGRPPAMGRHGVVASAHQLASMAGIRVLMAGGNAVDAAVAVAAALNVVEPYMSGLGGNGYMLITAPGSDQPFVLDYSGYAPRDALAEQYTPEDKHVGPKSPLIPGAPAGWLAALEHFGRLAPEDVFADAIAYAEEGVPVTFKNAAFIAEGAETIARSPIAAETFLPNGDPPRPGTILRQPRLAETFRILAAEDARAFYRGPIGRELVRAVQEAGGVLSEEDLAGFSVEWQQPASVEFRGYQIFGPAPPCAALEYLELLKLLENADLSGLGHNSADYLHLLIEAVKLASADRIAYTMRAEMDHRLLFDPDYIATQRERIDWASAALGQGERFGSAGPGATQAGTPFPPAHEHTTHFAVADASGMAVNVTQSIGAVFGSGFMAGETGILLNNLLYWTDLDRLSPNTMQPGKKMENPMSPAQIYRDGQFYATLGTPGSWGILQTTPQMILNLIVHGMNIQEAIEAPRFRFMGGRLVSMEERIAAEVRTTLTMRGHEIEVLSPLDWKVGGGHGTMRDPESSVLMAGADPRRDGIALAW